MISLEHDYENLKVIDSKVNCGYGASLKGILAAKYDSIVITDADGTYPNGRIPEFIKELEKMTWL